MWRHLRLSNLCTFAVFMHGNRSQIWQSWRRGIKIGFLPGLERRWQKKKKVRRWHVKNIVIIQDLIATSFFRPRISTNTGKSCLKFSGSKIWEIVPVNLKCVSYNTFKKEWKRPSFQGDGLVGFLPRQHRHSQDPSRGKSVAPIPYLLCSCRPLERFRTSYFPAENSFKIQVFCFFNSGPELKVSLLQLFSLVLISSWYRLDFSVKLLGDLIHWIEFKVAEHSFWYPACFIRLLL